MILGYYLIYHLANVQSVNNVPVIKNSVYKIWTHSLVGKTEEGASR